jgi:hypothetical protein
MIALSTIIACITLLGIAVLVLHNYQLRAASNSAERSAPLMAHGNDLYLQSLEIIDSQFAIPVENSQADNLNIQIFQPFDPEERFIASVPNASIEEKPQTADKKASISQYDKEAPQYPLLGAYTQCCIELRQRLKNIKGNPKLLDTTLHALYRTAAVAELLHSKNSEGKLSLGQLKLLPDELITGLDMPYDKLGYSELRLLRKSDIKRMLQLWGKPQTQQCPRNYHRQSWRTICQRYS